MTAITKTTTLKELAGIIGTALNDAGIDAVLIGGAAVSIYTDNVYQTYDLDFMIAQVRPEVVADVLKPLGFVREGKGRHFSHPNTEFLVEFPTEELNFGETSASLESVDILSTSKGNVRVITPTQSVMDRMAAYIHWKDEQSYNQAMSIVRDNTIDWKQLYEWAAKEDITLDVIDDLKRGSFLQRMPEETIASAMDMSEYEHEILKDAEDYRAGCLETSSLAEVKERLRQ